MRILAALLAGGRSTRFGCDKALAVIDGVRLIDHAAAALGAHADTVICCGRAWPGLLHVPDRPAAGAGPLSGLNAALHHAAAIDFDAVLCAPVDVHPLAQALPLVAAAHCAVLETQWTIGIWPTALAPTLDEHLRQGGASFRGWLALAAPEMVPDAHLGLLNINRRAELPAPA
jgi:molybdopterin-guanine dinucleotide biosynthesis protein A